MSGDAGARAKGREIGSLDPFTLPKIPPGLSRQLAHKGDARFETLALHDLKSLLACELSCVGLVGQALRGCHAIDTPGFHPYSLPVRCIDEWLSDLFGVCTRPAGVSGASLRRAGPLCRDRPGRRRGLRRLCGGGVEGRPVGRPIGSVSVATSTPMSVAATSDGQRWLGIPSPSPRVRQPPSRHGRSVRRHHPASRCLQGGRAVRDPGQDPVPAERVGEGEWPKPHAR